MGIGGGIFLIVVGAILAFAVKDSIDAIDLTMVGYICIAAGVLALIISIVITSQRSNTTHREVIERNDNVRQVVPPATQPPVAQAPAAQPTVPPTVPPTTQPPAGY